MSCVFCKIVAREIPSAEVYEDDKVLAFLDINPVNKGHVLLIPKEHYENMEDAPDELLSYIFVKAKELKKKIKEVMRAQVVVVSVVGLDVPHFHVHLVPRYKNDGLANWWPTKVYKDGEMAEIAKKFT